eukprot:scaffold1729_cov117-Cylindrotheca_fusiformis.AAC.11
MGEPLLLTDDTDLPATAISSHQEHDKSGDSEEQNEARRHGTVVGILAQVINVSGTAYICYKWDVETGLVPKDASGLAHYLHWVLWIITQVDFLLYLLVWIGLTTILTDTGAKWDKWCTGQESPRFTFIIAVAFLYAGAAMGLILSWVLLHAAFGIRAPVIPIMEVLVFGFLIVYSITIYFDDDQNQGNEEGIDEETACRLTEGTSTVEQPTEAKRTIERLLTETL